MYYLYITQFLAQQMSASSFLYTSLHLSILLSVHNWELELLGDFIRSCDVYLDSELEH